MRGFAFLAFIAACGAEGVYVDVRVPPEIEGVKVDLYLGLPCDRIGNEGCDAMTPPRLEPATERAPVDGKVLFSDSTKLFQSDVEGGVAHFYLAPQDLEIPTAIAVSHKDGVNTGVALLASFDLSEPQRLIVELSPIADHHLLGNDMSVEVWERPDQTRRCIGVTYENRTAFIVPADDADCDQVAVGPNDRECNPAWHLATEPPQSELTEQECAVAAADLEGACVLGDRPCDETQPLPQPAGECVRGNTTYCVPSAACACDRFDDACLATLLDPDPSNPPEPTRIECVIAYERDGNGGARTCPDQDLNEVFLGDGSCGPPLIADLELGSLDSFAPTVLIDDPAGDIAITPLASASSCRIEISPPNAVFSDLPSSEPYHEILKIDADPANPATRFLLMPLDIVLVEEACDDPIRRGCTLRQDPTLERITKCLAP